MRQSTSLPCNHYARLAMARVIQSASTAQQLSRKVEFDACHPVVHHTGGPCDRGAAKFIIESKCILCGSNKVFFFIPVHPARCVCGCLAAPSFEIYNSISRLLFYKLSIRHSHTHTHTTSYRTSTSECSVRAQQCFRNLKWKEKFLISPSSNECLLLFRAKTCVGETVNWIMSTSGGDAREKKNSQQEIGTLNIRHTHGNIQFWLTLWHCEWHDFMVT